MSAIEITELSGDGIGPELEQAVHAVAGALPADFAFRRVDWSLAARESRGYAAIDDAEESMRQTGLGLKYPTVTKTRSPNALIRRRCNFSVIYRPAISISGIDSNFKEDVNLHIVRIATKLFANSRQVNFAVIDCCLSIAPPFNSIFFESFFHIRHTHPDETFAAAHSIAQVRILNLT